MDLVSGSAELAIHQNIDVSDSEPLTYKETSDINIYCYVIQCTKFEMFVIILQRTKYKEVPRCKMSFLLSDYDFIICCIVKCVNTWNMK